MSRKIETQSSQYGLGEQRVRRLPDPGQFVGMLAGLRIPSGTMRRQAGALDDDYHDMGNGWLQDLNHGEVFHPDHVETAHPAGENGYVVYHDHRGDLQSGPFNRLEDAIGHIEMGGEPQAEYVKGKGFAPYHYLHRNDR